jgi:hypothetical protein
MVKVEEICDEYGNILTIGEWVKCIDVSDIIFDEVSHKVHWYEILLQDKLIVIALSGSG